MKSQNLLIGLLLFLIYFSVLILTLKDTGLFWDEPAYFSDSLNVLNWIKKPSYQTIDSSWGPVQLSPPFQKYAQALSWEVFYHRFGILSQIDTLRLPTIILSSLLVLSVYLFTLKYFNLPIAVSSAIFLTLNPRFFSHAHFGSMDLPLTFFIFLAFWALWEKRRKLSLLPAFFLGLALLSKIASLLFLLPFSLFLFITKFKKGNILFLGKYILILTAIPLFMLFIFWPKLWVAPLKYFSEFFIFFSSRLVPFYYFGQTYFKPPWHFSFVILSITIPPFLIFYSILGILSTFLQKEKRLLKMFLLLNFLFLPVFLSLPKINTYDAERLLLPSFPFMSVLGGIGLYTLSEKISSLFKRITFKIVWLILLSITLSTLALPFFRFYPFTSSYYNLFIGGLKGAEKIGMEPQYTIESQRATLDYLNKNCPKNCLIGAFSNSGPFYWYQKDRLIKSNIKIAQIDFEIPENATYLVLPVRKSMFFGRIWEIYFSQKPVFSYSIEGVSLVNIYSVPALQKYYEEKTIRL